MSNDLPSDPQVHRVSVIPGANSWPTVRVGYLIRFVDFAGLAVEPVDTGVTGLESRTLNISR